MALRAIAAFVGVVLVLVSLQSLPAQAKVPITIDETWSIDIGYYIEKIDRIFFGGQFAEKHPEAAKVKFLLEKLGFLALGEYSGEFHLGDGKLYLTETINLDPRHSASLLHEFSRLPDREISIGRIVDPRAALLTISILNPVEKLEVLWNAVRDEELWNEIESWDAGGEIAGKRMMLGFAEMGLQSIGGFETLKSVIGDEIDIVLIELPEGDLTAPGWDERDIVAVIALKVDDFDGLNKLTEGYISQIQKGAPLFSKGGMKFYSVMGDGLFGIGNGYVSFGTNPKRLKEIITALRPTREPITANCYFRLDVNRLWRDHLEPLTRSEMIPYPSYAVAMHKDFWDITTETDFGTLEIIGHSEVGKLSYELTGDDDIMNLFGMAYTLIMALSVSSIAEEAGSAPVPGDDIADVVYEREWESVENLHVIDAALQEYGADHWGIFPKDLGELVEQGYLEAFPPNPYNDYAPMVARMPTDFSPGDFSYRVYLEDSLVRGYHLLLFGTEPFGGIDVLGPENSFEEEHWAPDEDGIPDGIILVLEYWPE